MVRSFESFLNSERVRGKRFMWSSQVYEERFDRKDYSLIERIWSNGEFINWLY